MKLSRHFPLSELTKSQTAERLGINNSPDNRVLAKLKALARYILEPVRLHYGIPFVPSSGYRCPILNKAVGSNSKSQHVQGEAVDFEVPTIANRDLADWIKENLIFDQLILEFHDPDIADSGWVHCSYREGNNRNQCLIFDGKSYRPF